MSTNSEILFDLYISIEEVLRIINKLLYEKTTRSDEISNEVLKKLDSEISIDLIQEIRKILVNDLLLIRYKKSTIVILYKKDKRNYFLLKSYKLIVLENILKVVKKVFITRLSRIVETYFILS